MEDEQSIPKRPSTFPMFSKYFTIQPVVAVDYATESKKQFEDFVEGFKRRIQVQLDYAKGLQACSKCLDKYIDGQSEKSISFICSAFKVEHEQRANQAKQLAEGLKTEIYQICSAFSKTQATTVKKIDKQIKKYMKQYRSLEENLDRTLATFEKVSKDTQELLITKNFLKYTSQIPQDKKIKLITKTMDGIRQKKQYQKLYLSANKNYNEFVRVYNKQRSQCDNYRCVVNDLNQLQSQIREQISLQADCLRKLIVCEVSMFKNIEYDLINISKQMEGLDTQKDIDILVETNKSKDDNLICSQNYLSVPSTSTKQKRKSTNMSEISSTKSSDDDLIRMLKEKESQIGKDMLTISLKNVEEEIFDARLTNRKKKGFKELVDRRWKELNEINGQSAKGKQQTQQNGNVIRQELKQTEEKGKDGKQDKQNEEKISEKQKDIKQGQTQQAPPQNANETQKVQNSQSSNKNEGQTSNNEQGDVPKNAQQQNKKNQVNTQRQNKQEQERQPQNLSEQFTQFFKGSIFYKDMIQQESDISEDEIYSNFLAITQYISEIWNGISPTFIQVINKKDKSKVEKQSPYLRIKKILQIHHFYRIVAYTFLENFRTHHQVMIGSPEKARQIGKFISSLITKSTKQSDVFVLRGLLGLLFTYYWIDEQNQNKKLLYVQKSVYKNGIWKKHDFWDAALFESTYEQMTMFGSQKGQSQAETILRQKNLIFSQLASYCHYMIMLGIVSNMVRQIVGRYCRLYQMSDEQNKDLRKMITNTVKQYKEIAAAYKEEKLNAKENKSIDD